MKSLSKYFEEVTIPKTLKSIYSEYFIIISIKQIIYKKIQIITIHLKHKIYENLFIIFLFYTLNDMEGIL
jgi:hypothetical protein